ncbi:hypothetical protein [Ekhidna sp. To15]|uniref:hypothetical protein n=1 Tax=Ekhidna sp. To15 TaxID=3395267 RepID=UPI003F522E79
MSFKLKKIVKGVFILFLSVLLLILLAIGVVVNFVFSPEKLTPKATEIANEYIDGRLDLESVELTFFSTFPDLEVEIDNGLLISNTGDSLLAFESLDVYLNPVSIFSDEKIHIDELIIAKPIIYAQMDSTGSSNWNILKDQPANDTLNTEATGESGDNTYIIDNIEIREGSLRFNDFTNYFSIRIQSMGVLGEISYLNELVDCDLNLAIKNMALTLNDEPIINPVSINFHSRSSIDLEENLISIDTVNLNVVDHELEIASKGSIMLDSIGAIVVDLENRLFTSNIREALDLVPIRYVNLERLEGKGEVALKANIKGEYFEDRFPVVELDLKISGGEASYKGFSKRIELFETKLAAKIDYLNKSSSTIDLSNLKVVSDGLSIQLNGKIDKILTNPHVMMSGMGGIDFVALLETIPVEGLQAIGSAQFDLNTDLFLEDVINYNLGKIMASGSFNLTDIDINYADSIRFVTSSLKLDFGQEQGVTKFGKDDLRLLSGRARLKDYNLNINEYVNATGKGLKANFTTSPATDSIMISPVRSNLSLSKAKILFGDTLSVVGNNLKGMVYLRSAKNNPSIPRLKAKFTADRIRIDNGLNYATLKSFESDLNLVKRKKRWPMNGQFGFKSLNFFTTSFPKKVWIKNTKVDLKTNELTLDEANVMIGKSDVILSGKIFNLQKNLLGKESLTAELTLKSNFLNINQITRILDRASALEETSKVDLSDTIELATDTTLLETFVVPKNIDFKLKINLKKVRYGALFLRGVKGNLFIKNQTIRLKNLRMKTNAADLWTNARYVARNNNRARANFNLKLTDVDVANMFEVLPFMDTLLPMTKDFEGNLNIGMQGSVKIGKHMEVIQSSIEAVARIEGKNLVLLDGETFQYLAKTLKFKNREKNTLDTVAVEMAIENGALEIFPSLVSMDRYKVAVGGIQNLDLTYNYHISVLESPLPFKTGIDIFGKAEEYDFKITKAKYKYIFSDKAKHKDKVDPALMKKKNEILEKIKFDQ